MPEPLPPPPADPVPLALVPRVDQARHYFAQAKAANTLRSYRAGWQHFVRWCAAHALQALPATRARPPTRSCATCSAASAARRAHARGRSRA